MLDGLLGRSGFYTKCKSLIKQTRTRIEVVMRKRNATQRFLRKDVADLLSNGLENNAYARVEGLVKELILSSCYEFIDHVCEIILKHLPVLQKLRDCPEDCREAVASLMYAAARFSDLPELRELRDCFQERYGSSLEYYVNQKLVENITSKPPSMEKKVQLMREIATEFTIWWDSRGFEERLSNPVANEKNNQQSPVTHHPVENKVLPPSAEVSVHKSVKDEVLAKKSEATSRYKERVGVDTHRNEMGKDDPLMRRDDLKHNIPKVSDIVTDRYKPPSFKQKNIQDKEEHVASRNKERVAVDVHQNEMGKDDPLKRRDDLKHNIPRGSDIVTHRYKPPSFKEEIIQKKGEHAISYQKTRPRLKPHDSKENGTLEADSLSVHKGIKSPSKVDDEIVNGLKSNYRSAIPPPYVKPRKNKHKTDEQLDTLTFNPGSNSNNPEKIQEGVTLTSPQNGDEQVRFTEIYYKDASSSEISPRRRSHRRRHSRSTSSKDDKGVNSDVVPDEERVMSRVSTTRRKHESRKGLQILFDDSHYKKDEEERMIDKLLLHYSKKPSGDIGKPKRKTANKTVEIEDQDSTPSTSRSFSLPSRHVTEVEPQKKVFTRAVSFQQETPAKHVHPKLPNYDDLAARLAAIRASKD